MTLSLAATTQPGDPGWQAFVAGAFEQHHRRIVGALARSVRDPDLAEDLAAEAFARLAREAAAGRAPDDAAAWLHRVAHNLLVSDARRSRVARIAAPRLLAASSPDGPEESVIERDEARRLGAALRSLPADHRAALTLAAAGWSSGEIGRRLGRTDVGVRTILCRARRQLRTQVAAAA
jgi:RNA polymerase sigma-70 factor, ECF subfamily